MDVRVGKVRRNPLMKRTEMTVEMVSKDTISRRKAKEVMAGREDGQVIVGRLEKDFGSERTRAVLRVYDDQSTMMETEATHLLIRDQVSIRGNPVRGRKQAKELKNRRKKIRGTSKPLH